MSTSVGTLVNGSICAVAGSGKSSMSDSSMVWKPRIDEPSKPIPSANSSSVMSATGIEKCCQRPGMSMKRRSTIFASLSFASLIASFTLMSLDFLSAIEAPPAPSEMGAEGVDQAHGEGVLGLHLDAVLEEERLVRHVAPELEAREEPAVDLVLAGEGDLLDVLADPGHEAVGIVEPFHPGRQGPVRRGLPAQVAGDSLPPHGDAREAVLPVVVVGHEAEGGGCVEGDDTVPEVALVGRVVLLLGAAHEGADDGELGMRLQRRGEPDALAPVVVDRVVPAVDQEAVERELVVSAVGRAHAHVVVGDGQREQQRARVVPVVLGLDDLRPEGGDELADVELQSLAGRGQVAQIALLEDLEHVGSPGLG